MLERSSFFTEAIHTLLVGQRIFSRLISFVFLIIHHVLWVLSAKLCSLPGETFRITACKRLCRVCHSEYLKSSTRMMDVLSIECSFVHYLRRFLLFLVLWSYNFGQTKLCSFLEYACFVYEMLKMYLVFTRVFFRSRITNLSKIIINFEHL